MSKGKSMSTNSRGRDIPDRIFIDGAGQRPDGTGSGFAWVRASTGAKRVQRVDGLTNNQAEYRAMLAALDEIAQGSEIEILTDSVLVAEQFHDRYKVRNPILIKILSEVRALIARKKLTVCVSWIPREENIAGKLL